MRPDDYEAFRMSVRVLGASYEQFIGDEHVRYYWSVLEDEPFDAVETLCSQLTRAEHTAGAKMPSAYQLRKQVHSERSGSLHELPCQHEGCRVLIAWPSPREDEGRFFCPRHQPEHGRPASAAVKIGLLEQLKPAARALMRSIDGAMAALMDAIPITDDERKAAEVMNAPLRARAFEDKAEGPGVNPSTFLNHPFLAADLPADYTERRQMVAAAGWKYQPSEGQWRKGKRVLSDGQVDSFSDTGLLQEFLGRR